MRIDPGVKRGTSRARSAACRQAAIAGEGNSCRRTAPAPRRARRNQDVIDVINVINVIISGP